MISGIPDHPIEDIKLSEVYIQYHRTSADASLAPVEKENAYPEPNMFGSMPARGFYIRHVNGLEMSHVEIEELAGDARPAFVLDQVKSADLLRIRALSGCAPIFALKSVDDFHLYLSRPLPDTNLDHAENKNL